MTPAAKSRVRKILKRAGSNLESLQKLIQNPEAFAKEAGFSPKEAASLRGADLVIAVSRNPLAGLKDAGTHTTPPMTITVTTHGRAFVSGDPPFLNQLDKNELINVLRQALVSPEYSEQLRKTLNLER
ncbi:MAG TPA: hypothetical protein VIY49_05235 [Bryobacteraceae bacterium]